MECLKYYESILNACLHEDLCCHINIIGHECFFLFEHLNRPEIKREFSVPYCNEKQICTVLENMVNFMEVELDSFDQLYKIDIGKAIRH